MWGQTPRQVIAALSLLAAIVTSAPVARAAELQISVSGVKRLQGATVLSLLSPLRRQRCAIAGVLARSRLLRLYRSRGYRLARVRFRCKSNALSVQLDEGQIGKIIVKGIGTLRGILVQFKCKLPDNVFHAPTIRKRLRRLKQENKDVLRARFRLVTSAVRKRSTRWEEPTHDLEILIRQRQDHGLLLDITYSSEYGLLSAVGYQRRQAGLKGSRWSIVFRLGLDVVGAIRKKSFRKLWSHVGTRSTYAFPPLVKGILRPSLDFFADLSIYGRPDMLLEEFYWWDVGLRATLEIRALPWLRPHLSLGVVHDQAFRLVAKTGETSLANAYNRWRGQLVAGVRLDFSPEQRRSDRGTEFSLSYAYDFQRGADFHALRFGALHVFEFGFHELFLRGQGVWIFGAPGFIDLVGLAGPTMRAFFGGRYYVRAALTFSTEFRVSLYKDLFHLGIFNDVSLFGRLEQGVTRKVAVADALGPGVHVLLLDVLQIDLYYAFGFAERQFSHNVYFSLKKVF